MTDVDKNPLRAGFPPEAVDLTTMLMAERPRYSICTMVTRRDQYAQMVMSFRSRGFDSPERCEFLYLDNSSANKYDAFAGYNLFLRAARGKYIILCHQDVILLRDGFSRLNEVIEELDALNPQWGLFGNAGGIWPNNLAIRISDKFGKDQSRGGAFPIASLSLDENFIVTRADANLAVSADLKGFHLYGTDLCLIAEQLGYRSYIVNFHLQHNGEATMDETFWSIRESLIRKYTRYSRPRVMQTTATEFVITPWRLLTKLANTRSGMHLSKLLNRLSRPRG